MLDDLPEEILDEFECVEKSEFMSECIENESNVLDLLWEKINELNIKYINTTWIDNLGIDKKTLLKDIKLHCIFVMYFSLISKDSKGKGLDECFEDYYSKINDSDPEKSKLKFEMNFKKFIIDFIDGNYKRGFFHSDFYYIFENGIDINRESSNEKILSYIEPLILHEILANWDTCPYNINNKKGMTFEGLLNYRKKYNILMIEDKDEIHNLIISFIVERLFHISFLNRLAEITGEEYEENIKKQSQNVRMYKNKDKYTQDEKYNYLLKIHYDSTYDNKDEYKILLASHLLMLTEIVSCPMVFFRNEYINMINKEYKDKLCDNYQILKLRSSFYYLNSFLIPFLVKQYYINLFNLFHDEKHMADEKIKEILKEYLIKNLSHYNYRGLYKEVDNEKFKEFFTVATYEAFQINVTELIYNYSFGRTNLKEACSTVKNSTKELYRQINKNVKIVRKNTANKSENIFTRMKIIEQELYKELSVMDNINLSYKYKFPKNHIYLDYLNSKKDKI